MCVWETTWISTKKVLEVKCGAFGVLLHRTGNSRQPNRDGEIRRKRWDGGKVRISFRNGPSCAASDGVSALSQWNLGMQLSAPCPGLLLSQCKARNLIPRHWIAISLAVGPSFMRKLRSRRATPDVDWLFRTHCAMGSGPSNAASQVGVEMCQWPTHQKPSKLNSTSFSSTSRNISNQLQE